MKLSLSIIFGLLAVIAFLIWRLSGISSKLDSANSALTEKSDSIRYFRSESGKIVAEKTAAEISLQDFRNHYSGLAAELRDIKVREKSLKALLKASMEAKGEGVVRVVHDTIFAPGVVPVVLDSVLIDDSWLRLSGRLHNSEFRYKYSYSDSILMAISRKRKGWFGKTYLVGSARLSNPNARVTNSTSILIRERQKRFVISAGVIYDPFSNRFAPGVSCGYAIMKF